MTNNIGSRNHAAIECMRQGKHESAVEILRSLLTDVRECGSLNAVPASPPTPTTTPLKPPVAVTVCCEPGRMREAIYNRAFIIDDNVPLPVAVAVVCFNFALASHFVAIKTGSSRLFTNSLILYKSAHEISMTLGIHETVMMTPVLAATLFQMASICAEFYDRERAQSLRALLARVVRGASSAFVGSQDCTFYDTNLFFAESEIYRSAPAA